MLVREVMTREPTCCNPHTKVDVVARIMLNHDCGAVPVCEGERVTGMITDRDIACRVVAKGITPVAASARDVMSKPAYTIGESDSIERALSVMGTRQIRRLPVVDSKGTIVGIVSVADIAAHLPDAEVADLVRHVSRKSGVVANAVA